MARGREQVSRGAVWEGSRGSSDSVWDGAANARA